MKRFDILVIGGGHAGIEAACAGANMGCSVGLVTMDRYAMGRMSCNPAIGGTAKGHLVHEIDALGGMMGLIADRTGIQFRVLNKSTAARVVMAMGRTRLTPASTRAVAGVAPASTNIRNSEK